MRYLAATAALLVAAFLPGGALPQDAPDPNRPPGGAIGGSREAVWFAPTAEDWKKSCLVTFQRTWDDAVAVSKETGKPILICVNMDGEIASEHYAGVRYRRPDTASLYDPYVCVVASVYRHTPRDYDERGHRIPCPRFGSVTCGEHIAIEPPLYEKYFDGKRIAPRHIAIELDASEKYDVYYAWDTASVFDTIQSFIAERPAGLLRPPPGDRSLLDRVTSRDVRDREFVERAFATGDRPVQLQLLASASAAIETAPVDLLRLAILGGDAELARRGRQALAGSAAEPSIDLISAALQRPMDAGERQALVGALEKIGETVPRARTLALVNRGLGALPSAVDAAVWDRALDAAAGGAGASYAAAVPGAAENQAQVLVSDDTDARIALAESLLASALAPDASRKTARLLLLDAERTAKEAETLGASGPRVDAILALTAHQLGRHSEALARAANTGGLVPGDASGFGAMALLALFAESRSAAISKAVVAKEPWPDQWLTDVNAAYSVLARHPLGTDFHVAAHVDFLKWLAATAQAARVLDEGLARFPDSFILHDRLRARILAEHGADGLEPEYERRLQGDGAPAGLEAHAGYTSLVAAEYYRRGGRRDHALAAYDRAIAHYQLWSERDGADRAAADHFIALALAGRARLAFERGDLVQATSELVQSFERSPSSAATLDGLNLSPVDTAKLVRAKASALQREDLVATLGTALDRLDPALLEPPAYETAIPDDGRGRPRRRPRNP